MRREINQPWVSGPTEVGSPDPPRYHDQIQKHTTSMNLKSRRRFGALICIRGFRAQHPEAAAKPSAAAAFGAVDAAIDEVELLASGRLHSTNTFLSASAERQTVRAELHE